MRTVALTFKGEKYSLIYNVVAMFELNSRLGEDWTNVILKSTQEAFGTLAQAAEIMSEYGANGRAEMGFPRPKTLTAADVTARATVREYLDVYEAVCAAVNLGMERELVDEDEEVDLVLQEMQKKTDKKKQKRPSL